MSPISCLFATAHLLIAAFVTVLMTSEAHVFAWPWFLLWIALAYACAFTLNYAFVSRHRHVGQQVAVVVAGPLLITLVSAWWHLSEIAHGTVLEITMTLVVIILSPNIMLLPSWAGFFLATARRLTQERQLRVAKNL